MKFYEKFFFATGWIQIFLGPLFIALFGAIVCWIYLPGTFGSIAGFLVLAIGFIGSVLVANRVSGRGDPNDAIARISQTPDLDKMMESNKADEKKTDAEEQKKNSFE